MLPVESSIPELLAALAEKGGPGTAVLTAEPGAGKTTIVPLRLLDAVNGSIVVLEPRRIAARAAARRMAHLLGEDVGRTVGYVTRDERRTSAATRIEVVTEGILTRRLQRDPTLAGTGLVVFDEFHERSIHADLGLALALDVRRNLRPDLRILVMSATIDVQRVARLLGDGTAAVTSPGRLHPVDVRWVPRTKQDRLAEATAAAVRRALSEETGDVLVFLPGVGEINRVVALLAGAVDDAVDIRPLHGSLSAPDQDAALVPAPPGRRKVVLATDIAETSLTVDGVRVVVDAGLARVPRFDPDTGMTRLVTVPSSRASADQRAGRAGRTQPGVAYRLWSKLEHAARRPHIDPEISQVDLASFALELAAWGVSGDDELALLDPPPRRALDEARALLRQLDALDGEGRLTDDGRRMVDLPLHPRLAHMIVRAPSWLACVLAALLEDRDVLRGAPGEVPADIAARVALVVDPSTRHPQADVRSVRAARTRAVDIARRAGIAEHDVDLAWAGTTLALAYPDRVAQRRAHGQFRLRTGNAAWIPQPDPLAAEFYVVAADVDGHRKDARIRVAAAVDADEVVALFSDHVDEHETLAWDATRDDVIARVERRLGALSLGVVERRPDPGPATERVVRERLRNTRLELLSWDERARRLRVRLAFLHRHLGDPWPDVGDTALLRALDLSTVTSKEDVRRIDVARVLRSLVPPGLYGDVDRLAPDHLALPSGRTVRLDYDNDPPILAVRVQDAFGLAETPAVAGGRVRVVVHLLSPAGRPVQVTSDLAGFWTGSWHEVRKQLAGRYPKHAWPEIPTAPPPR